MPGMAQSHVAIPWGTIAALLFTGCIGAGLAWIGRGYGLLARATRDGVAATAVIERLAYTGPYVVGRFFALVSFRDADGISRSAEITLPAVVWNRLREGRALPVLYSAADPHSVTLGGHESRALFEAAGAMFVVLGVIIALTAVWILVHGLATNTLT
jgi:hypothetical protein